MKRAKKKVLFQPHVTDIFAVAERREVLTFEHNRAHRLAQENVKQVLSEYYFPKMAKLASEIVANCETCAKAKYDRHPKNMSLVKHQSDLM